MYMKYTQGQNGEVECKPGLEYVPNQIRMYYKQAPVLVSYSDPLLLAISSSPGRKWWLEVGLGTRPAPVHAQKYSGVRIDNKQWWTTIRTHIVLHIR